MVRSFNAMTRTMSVVARLMGRVAPPLRSAELTELPVSRTNSTHASFDRLPLHPFHWLFSLFTCEHRRSSTFARAAAVPEGSQARSPREGPIDTSSLSPTAPHEQQHTSPPSPPPRDRGTSGLRSRSLVTSTSPPRPSTTLCLSTTARTHLRPADPFSSLQIQRRRRLRRCCVRRTKQC